MCYGSHRIPGLMAYMQPTLHIGMALNHMKFALRIIYYLVGIAHLTLTIGGPGGIKMFATVDTSYAMHNDLKSHSCWTLHMNTGGAILSRTKKQSINTGRSTYSELVGAHLSLWDIQWARNFLRERLYYSSTTKVR